jgi:TM2 domain-containing membrane protein YozV
MEIEDDGTVVYHMPGRQKLAGPPAPPASPPAPPALVRMAQPSHGPSPALAGLLSALIPGAGHLYAERPVAAILWFLIVGLGYTLLLPGLILHLFSIASAASSARRLEAARARPLLASFSAR